MALDHKTIAELADLYLRAEQTVMPLTPIRERFPEMSEEDAYAVQAALVRLKLARGERLAGRKGGATNPAAQANFGLSQAVYGTLFDRGAVVNGGLVEARDLIHPRVECEVAFRLGRELAGPGVTPATAMGAVAALLPAFELVDARTVAWGAKMPEMIADNVFQARYVLGEERAPSPDLDLAAVAVTLFKNGQEAARATGANVLGSPLNALAWLANRLADHGLALGAGEIVLAGSLTPLVAVAAGDTVEAVFDQLGSVRLTLI